MDEGVEAAVKEGFGLDEALRVRCSSDELGSGERLGAAECVSVALPLGLPVALREKNALEEVLAQGEDDVVGGGERVGVALASLPRGVALGEPEAHALCCAVPETEGLGDWPIVRGGVAVAVGQGHGVGEVEALGVAVDDAGALRVGRGLPEGTAVPLLLHSLREGVRPALPLEEDEAEAHGEEEREAPPEREEEGEEGGEAVAEGQREGAALLVPPLLKLALALAQAETLPVGQALTLPEGERDKAPLREMLSDVLPLRVSEGVAVALLLRAAEALGAPVRVGEKLPQLLCEALAQPELLTERQGEEEEDGHKVPLRLGSGVPVDEAERRAVGLPEALAVKEDVVQPLPLLLGEALLRFEPDPEEVMEGERHAVGEAEALLDAERERVGEGDEEAQREGEGVAQGEGEALAAAEAVLQAEGLKLGARTVGVAQAQALGLCENVREGEAQTVTVEQAEALALRLDTGLPEGAVAVAGAVAQALELIVTESEVVPLPHGVAVAQPEGVGEEDAQSVALGDPEKEAQEEGEGVTDWVREAVALPVGEGEKCALPEPGPSDTEGVTDWQTETVALTEAEVEAVVDLEGEAQLLPLLLAMGLSEARLPDCDAEGLPLPLCSTEALTEGDPLGLPEAAGETDGLREGEAQPLLLPLATTLGESRLADAVAEAAPLPLCHVEALGESDHLALPEDAEETVMDCEGEAQPLLLPLAATLGESRLAEAVAEGAPLPVAAETLGVGEEPAEPLGAAEAEPRSAEAEIVAVELGEGETVAVVGAVPLPASGVVLPEADAPPPKPPLMVGGWVVDGLSGAVRVREGDPEEEAHGEMEREEAALREGSAEGVVLNEAEGETVPLRLLKREGVG